MYLCLLNALSISPSFKGMEKWDFMITNNFTAIKYYVPEVIFWTLRFTSSASQQFFEVKYCYPLKNVRILKLSETDLPKDTELVSGEAKL